MASARIHGAWRQLSTSSRSRGGLSRRRAAVQPRLVGRHLPAGLYDLPWALPFLWIALAARDWAARPRETQAVAELDPPGRDDWAWRAARPGGVGTIGAVALVPAVHQLAILLGSPPPQLAELRSHIALGGTLLVGGLYLARQLHTLRRAENTQLVSEERFRALVENSADAIAVVDAQGLFRY